MKTRLVWLSLGAAALSSTIPGSNAQPSAATVPAAALDAAGATSRFTAQPRVQLAENHQHGAPAAAAAGGEGGEDQTKLDADARLDPMVRFYRDIQLVRGHILVGDELVTAGLWADALPHFLHPVEELYTKLGPEIKIMKMKPFLQQLKVLAQTVKAKNAAAYKGALPALNERLDAVDVSTIALKSDWMLFAVETAIETMRSAIGEYGESIKDGKFAKAVEYQDARGFVWQADRLLSSVEAAITAKDSAASARLRTELSELKSAWPSPVPPAVPVKDKSQVASSISRIELAMGSLR